MKVHEKYIKRCIALAKNGLGTTYPNPLVGSVIVYEDQIIGEGWHQKAGGPHAEVHAIESVKDKSLLAKATIYVSLEPCSHFGKTPPCCDLILAQNIPNIVVGSIDPFAAVSGNGIRKLKAAGKNVTVGILETECRELNKRFFTFHEKKRPYIILKWAETADGFMAPKDKKLREPVWITNAFSRQLVHKWRTEEQAILIGTQTAIDDNPKLNIRDWTGNEPVRIVLDQHLRIPKENHIFDNSQRTILITAEKKTAYSADLIVETIDFNKDIAVAISKILFKNNIQSVIVEGGCQMLQTFLDANLWDEARIFKSGAVFKNGTKAPVMAGALDSRQSILNDELLIFSPYD